MNRTVSCKICQSDAHFNGYADFNKNCEINRGKFPQLCGSPVRYHRCGSCGFLFTAEFDHWTPEDWKRRIYNEEYHLVDPDYADGSRARANAKALSGLIRTGGACLDYGGGDGTFARTIREEFGFDCRSYDPIVDGERPLGLFEFDLITAFEVMEHTVTPLTTMGEILGLLKPRGVFLFSTLTLDIPPQSMDHWYIAPRNGHVSLHTIKSLDFMFAKTGRAVRHFNAGLHMAVAPT